jgi:hypothetical protein
MSALSAYTFRQISYLGGIIAHPKKMIAEISYQGSVWLPILLVALCYIALRMTTLPEVRAQYESPEFKEMLLKQAGSNSAQAERSLEIAKKYTVLLMVLEAPLLVAGGVVMMALMLFMSGRLFYQRHVPFKTVMTMVGWTGIISAIPLLLSLALYFINPGLTLPTNIAYFLPVELQSGYMYGVLSTVDLFFIWQAIIICFGVAKLWEVSINQSVTLVGTIMVMFAALFGLSVVMGQ